MWAQSAAGSNVYEIRVTPLRPNRRLFIEIKRVNNIHVSFAELPPDKSLQDKLLFGKHLDSVMEMQQSAALFPTVPRVLE